MKRTFTTLAILGALAFPAGAKEQPFQISVDGQLVTGSTEPALPPAEALNIDVKFDGLGAAPQLTVATVPLKTLFQAGENITFKASYNYGAWIERAEVRLYRKGQRNAEGLYQRLDVDGDGKAAVTLGTDSPPELEYVLRVYDGDGRFDETLPLPLERRGADSSAGSDTGKTPALGYAEDRTAVRNIDVHGGTVTVYGRNVPPGHDVYVLGELVPVDADGSFVASRIMPAGAHDITVRVLKDGEGLDFSRTVQVPENDWFAVGLADFTLGARLGDHVEPLRAGEFSDDVYTRGRLAFYLKGKIKGRYILTAAADTGDQKLKDIFKGLDGKDPRQFLSRLDPDDYYPVYGDDSVRIDDAPTRGKFYVRLDRGPSHVMWGNFKSEITGARLVRSERALYGAKLAYRSKDAAVDGGPKTKFDAHAALPGTVPNRDVFRGTGGSAYFLKHQDVTPGSETVVIEVRNAVTGWVIERRELKYGTDYDFDYVQGVIMLRQPLNASDGSGTENHLVASYEFAPAAGDADGYALGGRAQQWLGDHVRLGATVLREKTEKSNQTLYGADIHVRHSDGTYIEAEVAQSKGPGFGSNYSADGGITIDSNASAGDINKTATAHRIESRIALEDLSGDAFSGHIKARLEHYQKGFSSLDVEAKDEKRLWGAEAVVKLSDKADAAASYSEEKTSGGTLNREGTAKITARLSDSVAVQPYGTYTEKKSGSSGSSEQGQRADAGIKVLYAWDDGEEAYVFGQKTVQRTGSMKRDDRAGVGGSVKITDRLSMAGEVSTGTQGIGARALLAYEPMEDRRYTLGYRLDPQRDTAKNWPFALMGDDLGTIVVGAHHRFNEQWSAYAEDNFDIFGERLSLTQVYGVTFAPAETWLITGGLEWGRVTDNTVNSGTGLKNPDFDRRAVSLALDYKGENGLQARLKGEARSDDSEDDAKDVQSYLLQASVTANVSENWRALAQFDGVWTDATESTRGGDYAEGSFGFAYRPVEGDKLNVLAKLTYLYDVPGADQVSLDGTTTSPAQRSWILSADASYDVTPKLTLGAKYGFRIGQTKERTAGADWETSSAHLGIVRADMHIVHQWDLLVEGRVLWSPESSQSDFGAIAAIYRHFGDNLKIGIGYNFGAFSDDLRDLSQNDHGVFLNVIGKF